MRTLIAAFVVVVLTAGAASAQAPSPHDQLARDIYKQLIEINTTDSVGNTTEAADAMAARLKAAGFPDADVQVLGPNPRKGNLVARLRGSGDGKPVLLLAHLDVVEARKSDWSPDLDPFAFVERDGYFYGRGTSDDKAMAAIWVTNLIRMKQEGFQPRRDIILALTADEEGGTSNGVDWLLRNHRDLIDADFCLNEGGGGEIIDGRYVLNEVQASEKVYQSFQLEVTNPGGHSSLPTKDNAIYHLAQGLTRLAAYEFPVQLNPVTRTFFERTAAIEQGPLAADMKAVTRTPPDPAAVERLSESPYYHALLRTTCVATRLDAGHADNALPQLARALVNCRMLPGSDPQEIEQTLVQVLADDQISVTPVGKAQPSPPSPLRPDVMEPIERITREMWDVPTVPTMVTGATDGLYLRNAGIPTYGVSGLFEDINDIRAHGRDERMGVRAFYEGREFLYRLVRELTKPD
jgi:acetylornithine deacetylase/succinyl-diaminopimelate desuccinylase-like protein